MMMRIIRSIIAVVFFVLVGILLASNYEVRVLDVSESNTAMVKVGGLLDQVAFDFKFLNKHVVILKK
ncbi:hypothetical protein [Desulfogranum japonicum]|uniref:hypothetical protein n=1 Tax=Desulfogranum japonicum TaxID=231447 RepID=UPI000419ABB1|nr:hypothetical protein [Desulfogranum japonicum]